MSRAVVLSHRSIAHEMGPLGEWLDIRGFTVDRVYREDSPVIPQADLLIALGSPGSVAEGHCAPAGEQEIAQVGSWVESGRPYLGICFGSQALACALGGSVERMPHTDKGWMTLATDEASQDFLTGPWMVWHEDALTAPTKARVRAWSGKAHQAFSYERAWGIQFHPELDSGALERMARGLGAREDGYLPLVEAMANDEQGHRTRSLKLFDHFWDDVQ